MRTTTLLALAAGCSVAIASQASAQDALGSGRALDNNLNTQSGGRNVRTPSITEEVALRNALVTGNIGGGAQFRGDVGYTSPFDFRDEDLTVGSNDIFRFQADSFASGLATQNLRGLEGLRSSFARSTLGQIGTAEGQFFIERPTGGYSNASTVGTGVGATEQEALESNTIRIDPFGRLDGTLRLTSEYALRDLERPQILRIQEENTRSGVPEAVTASPLQGIRSLAITNSAIGYEPFTREPIDTLSLDGQEDDTRPGRQDPHRLIVNRMNDRIESMQRGELNSLFNTKVDRRDKGAPEFKPGGIVVTPEEGDETEADPTRIPTTGELLEQLRDDFMSTAVEFGDLAAPAKVVVNGQDVPEEEEPEAEYHHERVIDRAVAVLGGDRVVIDSLIGEGKPPSTFRDHMEAGQTALKDGRWFDAEERFTAALQAKRAAPMASAGRINAQIGAGMYRSAALNLRALYRTYPEMVSVRFSPSLLPTAERLTFIRDQLRERMRRDTAFARDAGLLLAYLGFHFESPEDIAEGFATIERVNSSLGVDGDPLDTILSRVWPE